MPDLVVTSPPVVVPPNSIETYPEPEMETGLTEDRYIKWIQVMPGESRVVHHVLVYAVRDEEDESAGGGPRGVRELLANRARGDFVGDWFEDGYARLLRKEDRIRLQLHYLPDDERSFTDRTSVGIKFYPPSYEPAYVVTTKAGTVMHVTAYHDNSAANRVNPDPTAAVGWGQRTIDEMNIGWLDYFHISEEEYAALQAEE